MYSWIRNVKRFCESIEKTFKSDCEIEFEFLDPLIHNPISDLHDHESCVLPPSLEAFYRTECKTASFWYSVFGSKMPICAGGFIFYSHKGMIGGLNRTRTWDPLIDVDPFSEFATILKNAMSFCDLRNGDVLAFDMRAKTLEPPIFYITHKGPDLPQLLRPISPSFADFLFNWERLCYASPYEVIENGGLNNDGFLDYTSEFGVRVRESLGINIAIFD